MTTDLPLAATAPMPTTIPSDNDGRTVVHAMPSAETLMMRAVHQDVSDSNPATSKSPYPTAMLGARVVPTRVQREVTVGWAVGDSGDAVGVAWALWWGTESRKEGPRMASHPRQMPRLRRPWMTELDPSPRRRWPAGRAMRPGRRSSACRPFSPRVLDVAAVSQPTAEDERCTPVATCRVARSGQPICGLHVDLR